MRNQILDMQYIGPLRSIWSGLFYWKITIKGFQTAFKTIEEGTPNV
jgi:hypothetical protein